MSMRTDPYPMRRRDKRSSRTRKALSDALFSLLEKVEFQKVTVNDICAKAEVSRPTFYTYFDDKYSLLSYCIEIFYGEALEVAKERGGSHRDILTAFLEHLERYRKSFRNLLAGETNRELSNIINTAFYQLNVTALTDNKEAGWVDRIPIHVTSLFRAGGTIATISWWLDGSHKIEIAEMVDYLLELNGSVESPFSIRTESI